MLAKSRNTVGYSLFLTLLTILFTILLVEMACAQGGVRDLTITTLYDNYSFNKDLMTGQGFSCLIRGTEKTILFDIGSDTVLKNMEKLKISPESIDVLVVSHNHPDHIGGMFHFLKKNSNVTVYIPQSFPEFFKYRVKDAGVMYVDIQDPVKIFKDVYSTGEMGTWIKEDALVIRTAKGLVVIAGCAHPGIVSMVKKAKEIFPKEDVYLAMGGFHMLNMDGQGIKGVISKLRKENVNKVAPSHCTGDLAISLLKEEYGDDFIPGGVGKEIKTEGAFSKPKETGLYPESKLAAK